MKKLISPILLLIFSAVYSQQSDTYYIQKWAKVQAFAKKDLIRSAIAETDTIYQKASAEKNTPEIVKAIINLMNFETSINDSATETWMYELQSTIKTASCPEKQLLSSMLAEMYWSYYERNRYSFYERTQTVNFDNTDIGTWDINKVVSEALKNYKLSLENSDSLKNINISQFDIILVKGNSPELRPTLYDFLAHRALTFYESREPEITRPLVQFNLNDTAYLSDYNGFLNIKLATSDTLSLKFFALQVLQQLIAFHSNGSKKDIAPLVDVDLERLSFIHSQAAELYNKDSLYVRALRRLKEKFSSTIASTDVDYQLVLFYNSNASYSNGVDNGTRWYKKKAIAICESVIKQYPESAAFGVLNCQALKTNIESKNFSFSVPQVAIPGKPFPALLSFQNADKLYIRIIRANPDKYEDSYDYSSNKLPKEWSAAIPVKEWSIDLPKETDYQYHSTEIKMPALPPGYYVMLVSSNGVFTCTKNLVEYKSFWSSNISYTIRTHTDGRKEYTLLDRTNGRPIKNAHVQMLYEGNYDNQTGTYKTAHGPSLTSDDEGHFIIHPRDKHYEDYKLDITLGNDRFRDFSYNYLYDQSYYDRKNMHSVTYFFTDRAIYRPGQTVYFKGILLQTDGDKNILDSNIATTVTLYDVNYQKITSLDLVSDAYGSVSGTFVLPTGMLNGTMRIQDGRGTKYVQVEDYKRPKFYVNVDTVKGNFRLGETINITGTAKAYNGSRIDGATVKYRVERKQDIPWWWYDFYWRGNSSPNYATTAIINGGVVSNDTGGFAFNFSAVPDLNISQLYNPTFLFTVYVDVTDANGETHSTQSEVKVGYTALNLDVQLPQTVDKSASDTFLIETTNMQGSNVPTNGNIVIYRLKDQSSVLRKRLWSPPDTFIYKKQSWDSIFPNDPYFNDDEITSRKKGEKVLEKNFSTGNKKYLKLPSFSGWREGDYIMEAHTKDIYGQDVKDVKYFTVFSPKEKTIPENTPDWFSVVKDNCEPGEKAKYLIGSAYDNVTVLYEIERKGIITHHEWLTLNHEQRLLEIPVGDSDRGGFGVHFIFVKNNRQYIHYDNVYVPWTNKTLALKFESFRDKLLPGQKEEWKIKVSDNNNKRATAELMATLYDASLDEFASNSWYMSIYPNYGASLIWTDPGIFGEEQAEACSTGWGTYFYAREYTYDRLISEGSSYVYTSGNYNGYYKYRGSRSGGEQYIIDGQRVTADMVTGETGKEMDQTELVDKVAATGAAPVAGDNRQEVTTVSKNEAAHENGDTGGEKGKDDKKDEDKANLSNITARSNFNETAFFYPQLQTDDSGNVVIDFTVPEASTRWKMMGMAQTKDLKFGYIQNELVTQKDLMVTPNAPRFLRESDTISLTAKITDLADKDLSGSTQLFLYDAFDMKDITTTFTTEQLPQIFSVKKGQSTVVTWQLIIPKGIDAVTYKVVAQAGNYSDGEQNTLPILTNSMLVTESIPLSVRGKQKRTFTFDKLLNQNNHSTTLVNKKVTLEFTANPAWYAIQALPYIMEYPYECAEQTFDRFYANSIATNIANSSPRIKAVFDSWKSRSPEAFLSNLEKNQDLKTLLLEETPWVLEAKDESERKKRIGLLFDLNKMSNELDAALRKLEKKQSSDGGWSWFPGMHDDRYITQYIITGFGHLDHLGIKNVRNDGRVWNMVTKGLRFLDDQIYGDYSWILKHDATHINEDHLDYDEIQYLYARSYFKDVPISAGDEKAVAYFKGQAQKYWEKKDNYMKGMIALALSRFGIAQTPANIMAALKENATNREDMGMYWAGDEEGYYWYQSQIEEHALMIEAFDEVSHDEKSVDALKVWLLRSKQTQDWGTTKATAEACYALLLKGTDILSREPRIDITIGDKKIKLAPTGDSVEHGEAGTGYFKTSWTGSDIKPEMGDITVSKSDSGISWGAVYWQYFEQLDKITPHKTPLNINKKLFVERVAPSGVIMEPISPSTLLHPGNKIKVRIELRVDRDMDYVQMKDMRASCMEPIDVISDYKYQDGLGYYQSTRDAATNFFFDHVSKGTYVFEYVLFVTHKGKFSNGVTTIQCMYAPEFNSHSEGVRVKVE